MNKKLIVGLSVTLLLFVVLGAGYLFLQNKKMQQISDLAKTSEEIPKAQTVTENPFTKEMILNGTYVFDNSNNIWIAPQVKKGSPIKFIDGVLDPTYSSFKYDNYTVIDKNNIAFGDLNSDGKEDAVFPLDVQYDYTDDQYNISKTLVVATLADKNLHVPSQIFLAKKDTIINSINIKDGTIFVDLTRHTGEPPLWPDVTAVEQFKLNDSKLNLQNGPSQDTDGISFISPKTGDVWKIGEQHLISLNKPLPYGIDCYNSIELEPQKVTEDSFSNTVVLQDIKTGLETYLSPGAKGFTWDTKTTTKAQCGVSESMAQNYGWNNDNTKVYVTPGVYRLRLYQTDTYHDAGRDIVIASDYFTIQ